jgi:hypothetical protein
MMNIRTLLFETLVVSIILYLYVYVLIMSVRKKAGAVHMESNGGSGTAWRR